MDIEIQAQGIAMQAEWRALVEERLARLAARYPALMRVHVTLKHGGHHLRGVEEVDVLASCSGGTLRAAKQGAAMRDALHAALRALERKLSARQAKRRRFGRAREDAALPGLDVIIAAARAVLGPTE